MIGSPNHPAERLETGANAVPVAAAARDGGRAPADMDVSSDDDRDERRGGGRGGREERDERDEPRERESREEREERRKREEIREERRRWAAGWRLKRQLAAVGGWRVGGPVGSPM